MSDRPRTYTIERTLKEVKVLRLLSTVIHISSYFVVIGVMLILPESLWDLVGFIWLPMIVISILCRWYAKLLYWWHNS